MVSKRGFSIVAIVACVALVVGMAGLALPQPREVGPPIGAMPLGTPMAGSGATNFSGIDIDTQSGATIAALAVSQHGTGDVVQFYDGATEVWSIADGGAVSQTGAQTFGGDLTVSDAFTVTQSSGNTSVAGTLTAAGAAALNGGIAVDTSAFTVADSTGNTVIAGTLSVGGGYGSTGASISNAGVGQFNGALTTDGALTADSGVFGGGYGTTGCTLSTAGVLQCNGAGTVDGALTAGGDLTVSDAFTVTQASGNVVAAGTGTFAGALSADSGAFGGGYGDTGCSISSAGVLQCDGAMTGASSLTIDSIAAGGGYGSTGCTLSTAGVLQCNGAGTVDGALTAGGDLTVSDAFTVTQASGNTDVAGTFQFGANDLYPVGYGTSGRQMVCGSDSISDTLAVSHGLTTPEIAWCTLGADVGTGAGDLVQCTCTIAGASVTVKGWQDDWQAGANLTTIYWCVIGQP